MEKLLLLLFSIILISYQTDVSSAGRCFDGERQALIKLKEGLIDPSNRLSSWIGENCCIWDGITCNNQTGHVEMLHLRNPITPYFNSYSHDPSSSSNNFDYYYNNCLRGEISHSILNLQYLRYLDLSSNSFAVQIPIFFGSLQNLRYLNLSGAEFVGEIPPHLGNLTNLEYLDLGHPTNYYEFTANFLTAKSLQWITKLTSLKALHLSGTNLSQSLDWFDSINSLSSLSSLTLRDCLLVGKVYPSLSNSFNLTSLVLLDMGGNYLDSTLPFKLLNFTSKLEILRMDGNHLEYLVPSMFKKLNSLSVLDLSSNLFYSSSVLDLSCNLTSLVYIDLSWNQINGSLPLCLGTLTSLKEVHLQGNKLCGKIPSELGYLKQLVALDLSSNSFNSSIPSSFGKLAKLKYLSLGDNQLSGTFPLSLEQLTELQMLDISGNLLTGEISESHFMKLKSLKYLYVSHNEFLTFTVNPQWIPPFQLLDIQMNSIQIGMHFPSWLKNQKNISILSLVNSSVSSAIPEWFGTVSFRVKTLHLSRNKIHGSLVSLPPNIVDLDLSNNLLTGIFHAKYCTISSPLQSFSVDNNRLSGSLPNCICNLSSLRVLSLSNNQLTGRIPPCIGNMRQLNVLNLANNSLSGHIPSTLGNLVALWFIHLNSNKLSGVVPWSLKNLKNLRTLDLGENQLSGTLQNWIGQDFSLLQFLRLESNNFTGKIFVNFCQLSSLQVLNLAQNNLAGHIPNCLGNLTMLRASNKSISSTGFVTYTEELQDNIKGIAQEYSSNLWGLKSISLSGNNLEGEIPEELMDLDGLQSLNLSNNNLSGRIPNNIGKLKQLESLDLTMNQLFGPIPPGLASIDTLGFLNLSFNHLSGAIPAGDHFQPLMIDPSVSEGNSGLCGKPLEVTCPHEQVSKGKVGCSQKVDERFEISWFYAGVGPGFAVGLLGVLCLLLFKNSWRHAYFRFWGNSFDRVWVAIVVRISMFKRNFN